MLAKESPEIDYEEVRELLVQPKSIMSMYEVNKMTICAFVDNYFLRGRVCEGANTNCSRMRLKSHICVVDKLPSSHVSMDAFT